MLTVLETCQISPPPATVGDRSLKLTFFDLQWLPMPPVHGVFFYDLPHSKTHFIKTIVPNLKHSLSITLQHFFPFASNLIIFPTSNDHPSVLKQPVIQHIEGDSVALTFAECNLDYNDLVGNHPRECDKFYPLVPSLGRPTKVSDYVKVPVFSVQVTFFPDHGVAIAITNHHVLCDASSKFDFMKAWASIFKSGNDESFLAKGPLPLYDRVMKYPASLDELYLSRRGVKALSEEYQPPFLVSPSGKVRATFVLKRGNINQLKKRVLNELPDLEYISSFSVTCGYVWSCLAKTKAKAGEKTGEDELELFICAADGRARLDPPIPQGYFGNCVTPCFATTKSTVLSGENGFFVAVELVGKGISKVVNHKDGVLKDAETWIDTFKAVEKKVGIAGSPKFKIYDIDFGWGKPRKHETVSIDYSHSISLNACREAAEDTEIGVSLPAKQMDDFAAIFTAGLQSSVF